MFDSDGSVVSAENGEEKIRGRELRMQGHF